MGRSTSTVRMLRCTVVLFLVATLSENQVTPHMGEFWWPRGCSESGDYSLVKRAAPGPPVDCCRTVGSNHSAYGEPCVFPFKLHGVEYNACTYVESEKLWCATEIEDNGDMVTNRYGDCDQYTNTNGKIVCPLTKCEAGSTWKTWDGKTCNCHDDGVAVCAKGNSTTKEETETTPLGQTSTSSSSGV